MTAAILLSLFIVIFGCKRSQTFHPPIEFAFPKRVFGSAKEEESSFRADCCLRYPWLNSILPRVFKSVYKESFLSSIKRDPASV